MIVVEIMIVVFQDPNNSIEFLVISRVVESGIVLIFTKEGEKAVDLS